MNRVATRPGGSDRLSIIRPENDGHRYHTILVLHARAHHPPSGRLYRFIIFTKYHSHSRNKTAHTTIFSCPYISARLWMQPSQLISAPVLHPRMTLGGARAPACLNRRSFRKPTRFVVRPDTISLARWTACLDFMTRVEYCGLDWGMGNPPLTLMPYKHAADEPNAAPTSPTLLEMKNTCPIIMRASIANYVEGSIAPTFAHAAIRRP